MQRTAWACQELERSRPALRAATARAADGECRRNVFCCTPTCARAQQQSRGHRSGERASLPATAVQSITTPAHPPTRPPNRPTNQPHFPPLPLACCRRPVCGARGPAVCVQVPRDGAGGHEHPVQPGCEVEAQGRTLCGSSNGSGGRAAARFRCLGCDGAGRNGWLVASNHGQPATGGPAVDAQQRRQVGRRSTQQRQWRQQRGCDCGNREGRSRSALTCASILLQ